MAEPVAPVAHDNVRAAIARASQATGVDFSLLVETARRESALNPNARAGTSSATGLFQFIDSTWLDMVARHGGEHGLAREAAALRGGADVAMRREILALRNDPEISARMAGELARENAATLQARLGRAPGAGELYAAHVMGAGGALRLIEAAEQRAPNAAALFPREAGANRGLFYVNDAPRSAQGLLARLELDASASMGAPAAVETGQAGQARGEAPMSPELARALFAIALLPLIGGGDNEGRDPYEALNAYARLSRA